MSVFFDFDGTLCDTFPIICAAMNQIRSESGLKQLEANAFDAAKGKVGLSTKEYVELFVGPDNVEENIEKYMNIALKMLPNFFPGIPALLERLRSRKLRIIVATNKQERIIVPLIDQLGCRELFDELRGVDYITFFPKPDPSELAADGPKVFIGDTRTDLLTAKNAGCPFIGVTYGLESRELLSEGSVAVVDTVEELETEILRCLGYNEE